MKKIVILILTSLFVYSLFREFTPLKILFMCCGIAAIYGVSLIPSRYILSMKYPVILLAFATTILFFVYPTFLSKYPTEGIVTFVSFYSIFFYLITMEEKGKDFFRDMIALSIIFSSSAFNLFMVGRLVSMIPIAVTLMLFLFILGKSRIIPCIAGYTVLVILILFYKKITILSMGVALSDVHRYLLLIPSFLLLLFGFSAFLTRTHAIALLAFCGILYITIDLFMVVGLRLSGGMIYQPLIALFLVAPILGSLVRTGGESA